MQDLNRVNCCQCQGIEKTFDRKSVRKALKRYHKKGPIASTKLLIEAMLAQPLAQKSLLEIGGGIGSLLFALLKGGVDRVTDIDGSTAYIDVTRQEAAKLGYAGNIDFIHGDFLDHHEKAPVSDIVVLNRVICCYPDMHGLVSRSLDKTKELYGIVYPKDNWLAYLLTPLANLYFKLQRNPFRTFLHPTREVHQLILDHGFEMISRSTTMVWQVCLYRREAG